LTEEKPQFVIRMADGRYYAARHGQRRWDESAFTSDVEEASRFISRWIALAVCAAGPQFAGAAILPYHPSTGGLETPPAGSQGPE
jgi:hypothetical protein